MDANDTTPTKICTQCGQTFPATPEYFHRKQNRLYGLASECKPCRAAYSRQYHINGAKPKPNRDSGYKTCTKCQQEFPATAEYFHRSKISPDGFKPRCKVCIAEDNHERYKANRNKMLEVSRRWREANPEKDAEIHRQWYEANRERVAETSRKWQQANREKVAARTRQYRIANRERIAVKRREYHKQNPHKARVQRQRRKARRRSLPDTLTHHQWQRALEYFNGCCAVCGNQLRDLFDEIVPHADHWIPLADPECPGTIATNMLPLCSACNYNKQAKNPAKWVKNRFGKHKAKQILERIEDYFEWVRSQN